MRPDAAAPSEGQSEKRPSGLGAGDHQRPAIARRRDDLADREPGLLEHFHRIFDRCLSEPFFVTAAIDQPVGVALENKHIGARPNIMDQLPDVGVVQVIKAAKRGDDVEAGKTEFRQVSLRCMSNPSLSGRGQALKKGRRVPKLRFERGR